MKPITYVPILVMSIAAAVAVGYLIAPKNSEEPQPQAAVAPPQQQTTQAQPNGQSPQVRQQPSRQQSPTAPRKRGVTPQAIAKAKNVPVTLENPKGNFTLVAVVEGVPANRRLNQSLQIVGAQRQRLAMLSRQFDKTPAASIQQRELIAGQLNKTRKTLEGNLQYMARNFAYSLNNNYVLVPHEASLHSVTVKDGKSATKLAYEFKNSSSYEDFQKKRDSYLRLKLEQAKAAQAVAKKKTPPSAVLVKDGTAQQTPPAGPAAPTSPAAVAPATPASAAQHDKLPLTPEMESKRKKLIALYQYDPEKNYQINFEKTALYARAAR